MPTQAWRMAPGTAWTCCGEGDADQRWYGIVPVAIMPPSKANRSLVDLNNTPGQISLADSPPTRRRWLQFRLRTLLVVMTLLAIPLGWISMELAQRRQEAPIVEWIEGNGGFINFNDRLMWTSVKPDDTVYEHIRWYYRSEEPTFPWTTWANQWLGHTVETIHLHDKFEASDLAPLKQLEGLQSLDLRDTQIDDLFTIAELSNLR